MSKPRRTMSDEQIHSCVVNSIPLAAVFSWRFPIPVHVLGYDEGTEQWVCMTDEGKVCRALAYQLEHEPVAIARANQWV